MENATIGCDEYEILMNKEIKNIKTCEFSKRSTSHEVEQLRKRLEKIKNFLDASKDSVKAYNKRLKGKNVELKRLSKRLKVNSSLMRRLSWNFANGGKIKLENGEECYLTDLEFDVQVNNIMNQNIDIKKEVEKLEKDVDIILANKKSCKERISSYKAEKKEVRGALRQGKKQMSQANLDMCSAIDDLSKTNHKFSKVKTSH